MTNCPNCGALLPINLTSKGTVKCEYCGGFIAVGSIDFEQAESGKYLTALDLAKKISEAAMLSGISLKNEVKK